MLKCDSCLFDIFVYKKKGNIAFSISQMKTGFEASLRWTPLAPSFVFICASKQVQKWDNMSLDHHNLPTYLSKSSTNNYLQIRFPAFHNLERNLDFLLWASQLKIETLQNENGVWIENAEGNIFSSMQVYELI